jgi:hypothetical protein
LDIVMIDKYKKDFAKLLAKYLPDLEEEKIL